MARMIKSLQQNADWGENRPKHREHRSRKGRNADPYHKSLAYQRYREQKEVFRNNFDPNALPFIKKRYRIKR